MFKYLDYIYVVYKEQNFSRAAEKLFISQSSLSLTIKHAEEEIGAEIFNRKTKPVSLTDFGKEYIKACEQILYLRSELENYVYDMNNLRKGTISIGAGNFFATYLIAPFVGHFKKQYPNININLVENRSADLKPLLEKGDLDLVISNADFKSPVLESQKLFDERLMLTIPTNMINSKELPFCSLSIPDLIKRNYETAFPGILNLLQDIPFIGLRPRNDTRIRTDQIYKEHQLTPQYFMELDQSSTAFIIASNQGGACIVSDTVIRTLWSGQKISIFNLDTPYASRNVCVYTNASKHKTVILQKFLELFFKEAPGIL